MSAVRFSLRFVAKRWQQVVAAEVSEEVNRKLPAWTTTVVNF